MMLTNDLKVYCSSNFNTKFINIDFTNVHSFIREGYPLKLRRAVQFCSFTFFSPEPSEINQKFKCIQGC